MLEQLLQSQHALPMSVLIDVVVGFALYRRYAAIREWRQRLKSEMQRSKSEMKDDRERELQERRRRRQEGDPEDKSLQFHLALLTKMARR